MMLGTRTKMGSRVPTWLLGKSGFLNVQLQMEQTGAALHTKRIYKSKPITVFLAFMGSFAGVTGALIAVMRFFERTRKAIKDEINRGEGGPVVQEFRLKEYYE